MSNERDTDASFAFSGWLVAVAVAGLIFLLLPIFIIAIVSFNESRFFVFPPERWSLKWYYTFLQDRQWINALWTSVKIASLTAVLATVLGLMASMALVRGAFRGKVALLTFLLLPLIVPHIIIAIGLYFFFVRFDGQGSMLAIALGHTVLALPVSIIILSTTLQGVDSRLEYVAKSLGASSFYALRHVTLPLIGPGLASSALFAFLTSFDELLVGLFLSSLTTQTLSVRIWQRLEIDVDPTLTAISSFLIGISAAILAIHLLVRRKAQQNKISEPQLEEYSAAH